MRKPTARSRRTVPGLSQKPETFFRLSPAEPGKAQCFAVKRGDTKERLDPKFVLHGGHQALNGVHLVPLSGLVVQEPDYGAPERAIPIQSPNDVKYIRITDFDDDGIVPGNEFSTARTIDDRFRLSEGDILFARSGATAGKSFIYSADIGPSIFAGYCIRFRFDTKRVLPQFVYSYTKTNRYQAWVRSIQRPSGQPNINKEEFKSFTIPTPALSIQHQLVAEMEQARQSRRQKLGQADALLADLDAVLVERLGIAVPEAHTFLAYAVRREDIKKSRCDALYHLPRVRAIARALDRVNCKKVPLRAICPDLAGGATPTRAKRELYAKHGIRFLRIMNVAPFEIKLDDIKYITPEVHDSLLRRSQLKANDILMTITGRVGTSALVPADVLPANINQHIVRMRICDEEVIPDYLVAYLNSSIGLALTNRGVTGGTRIALDYETIRNVLIPIPEEKLQLQIVDELDMRRLEARRLRQEAATEWQAAKARFESQLLGAEATK